MFDERRREFLTLLAPPLSPRSPPERSYTDAAKKSGPPTDAGAMNFVRSTQAHSALTVSRISATSSTDRAVVDPMSCRLGA